MDNKKYLEKLTRKTRKKYDKIKKIKCPCIGSDVVFNAKGFNHLLREVTGRDRTIKEKIYKLKLFPLAIPTIKNCKTINEIRQEKNATVDREKISAIGYCFGGAIVLEMARLTEKRKKKMPRIGL